MIWRIRVKTGVGDDRKTDFRCGIEKLFYADIIELYILIIWMYLDSGEAFAF